MTNNKFLFAESATSCLKIKICDLKTTTYQATEKAFRLQATLL